MDDIDWKAQEWWKDWRHSDVASKWGGEMTTEVEDMYRAFKARLITELVAAQFITYDSEIHFPLKEKS